MQRWINIPKNRDTMLHVVSRGMNQILLSNLDISFTKECVTDSKCRPTCQVAQINRFGQGILQEFGQFWTKVRPVQLLIEFRTHAKASPSIIRLICELFTNDQMDWSRDRYLDTIQVCLSSVSRDSFLPLIRLTRVEKGWIHLFAGFSR